jgi:hypothetical protein
MSETKNNRKSTETNSISRKRFIGQAAAATAGFMVVPRHVLGGKGYKHPVTD